MSGAAIVVDAGRVRAVFERHGDRWSHTIEFTSDNREPLVIMKAIEGTPEEEWPASPAIQELHCQTQSDGTVAAMGVGMAGRSHWSLSCRALFTDKQRTVGVLHFDMACRVKERFQRLGSSYRILPEATAHEFKNGLHYRAQLAEWMIAGNAECIRDANQTVHIDVLGITDDAAPRTVSWGYLIDPRGPV